MWDFFSHLSTCTCESSDDENSEWAVALYVYDTHYFVLIFQKIFHMITYAFISHTMYAYSETKEQKNEAFKKI